MTAESKMSGFSPRSGVDGAAQKVGPWGEGLTGRTQPGGDPGTTSVTDGPVMGNGNIGAVISGPPEAQCYCLARTIFGVSSRMTVRATPPRLAIWSSPFRI